MGIDSLSAFEKEPPELDFLWNGFLLGKVGALVAPSSTGNRLWCLETAMAISCEVEGGDLLGIKPKKNGKVVYYVGQLPELVVIYQLHRMGKHINPEARASIAKNLFINVINEKSIDIMNSDTQTEILNFCSGARLILFDSLSGIHTLDEKDDGAMASVVSVLEYIAETTKASVLFLHHQNNEGSVQAGTNDQKEAGSGASTFIDKASWLGFLSHMSKSEVGLYLDGNKKITEVTRRRYIRFGVNKQTLSIAEPDRWLKRTDGVVLLPVSLTEETEKRGGDEEE